MKQSTVWTGGLAGTHDVLKPDPNDAPTFSLVDGGATHNLLMRFGNPEKRDIVFLQAEAACAAFSWLPIFILCIVEGVAWGDKVAVPFLYDLAAYTRFLVAMPLLIIAESVIGPKLAEVGLHFLRSGRIAEPDYPRYRRAVSEAVRLRDSKWAEAAVLIIAYISTLLTMKAFAASVTNWRWSVSEAGVQYTLAAWWYVIISLPAFQFLLYRWILRMFIWSRFLYRMSRLDLKLVPTHPDRAGGIAFVGSNQRLFWMIVFAMGAVFAGVYGNEILYEGVQLSSVQGPAIAGAALLVFLIQAPGLFFFSMLRRTKRLGVFVYGDLALRYTTDFQRKWIDHAPSDEALLGSGDIQSLADMGNSYSVIEDMKLVPFNVKSSLWLAGAFLAPILPLQLTVMRVDELLQMVLRLLA